MAFVKFLNDLLSDGRVSVPPVGHVTDEEQQEGASVLEAFDRSYRLELPGEAPRLVPSAAGRAAVQLYRACQFVVFRDYGPEALARELAAQWDGRDQPETHYSVDLTFRFLPDLVRLARSISSEDPLVSRLMGWAHDWPLSSVGVPGVGDVDVTPLVGSDSLMCLYVDRIIARGDVSRLRAAPVREAVRAALGMHTHLAPEFAQALSEPTEPPS